MEIFSPASLPLSFELKFRGKYPWDRVFTKSSSLQLFFDDLNSFKSSFRKSENKIKSEVLFLKIYTFTAKKHAQPTDLDE